MKTSVFPRFFAYFAKSLCAWQCIWRLPKSIGFYHEKGSISKPGPPKSIQNRPQTYKNAKVEAKSSRKAILEALEIDFRPQDSDFGGQESDFGGQNSARANCMRIFRIEQRNAQGL